MLKRLLRGGCVRGESVKTTEACLFCFYGVVVLVTGRQNREVGAVAVAFVEALCHSFSFGF